MKYLNNQCIAWIYWGLFILFPTDLISQQLDQMGSHKPISFSGGIMAEGIFYNAQGISADREPFSYIVSGSPTINFYNVVSVPFLFTYSEQERILRQPFNLIGISPSYKWITLHLGYQNITYSQFTLGGHTILGGGIDLNPGIFRFGCMIGRFNRAAGLDTTSLSYQPYTYASYGYAFHIGIAKGNNFIDFSFLKAKDDSNSVHPGVAYQGLVTPGENAVIGMKGQIKFLKFFTFSLEAATSLYTVNLANSGPLPDSAKNIIVKLMSELISCNGSTEHFNAIQSGLGFQDKSLGLKLQYQRFDPDFKSMGIYFFNSDLENITLAPNLNLNKNKIRLSGSIGYQHDNLSHQNQSTNSKIIGSANISTDLTKELGFDFSFSDYSSNQQMKTVLLKDTFRIAQVSENISFTPRYILANSKYVHVLILSLNYNVFNTLDNSSNQQEQTNTDNLLLNYQITIVSKNLTLISGINYTKVYSPGFQEGNYGITLGINKIFDKGKLSMGWNGSFLEGINASTQGLILNQTANINYHINKHHNFGANVNYINNKSQQTTYAPNYSEWTASVNYRFSF